MTVSFISGSLLKGAMIIFFVAIVLLAGFLLTGSENFFTTKLGDKHEEVKYIQCDVSFTGGVEDGMVVQTAYWEENASLSTGGQWIANVTFRTYMISVLNSSLSLLDDIRYLEMVDYGINDSYDPNNDPLWVSLQILPSVAIWSYKGDEFCSGHLIQPRANNILSIVEEAIESRWFVASVLRISFELDDC